MKKKRRIWLSTMIIMSFSALLINSCKKEITRKDPVITWENPADVIYDAQLTSTQLNATADVPGTFVYTPQIGTRLKVGADQVLKVEFTPSDGKKYNVLSKSVKINVVLSKPIFNPNKIYGTMTDQEGNEYKTITIGTQTWMAENLRTTKYNDNTEIPVVTDATAWSQLTTPGTCTYNNTSNTDTITTYGRLYNWYAVNTGKLAPKGWHVPNTDEWSKLIDYIGNYEEGGKLKEIGTNHWLAPNEGADNSSGFSAIPAGMRASTGPFMDIGEEINLWSTLESAIGNDAWYSSLAYGQTTIFIVKFEKGSGYSVRCLKDN